MHVGSADDDSQLMNIAILLLFAADITGHVTGGDPMTEVRIRGAGVDVKVARPDAKGAFAFRNAASGYSMVEALSWRGKSLSYAWADWKGAPVELAMAQVKPLVGRVVMSGGGAIPKGLEVSVPGEITVKVGADGAFNLGVLPPEIYEIDLTPLRPGARVSMKLGAVESKGNEIDSRRGGGMLVITITGGK